MNKKADFTITMIWKFLFLSLALFCVWFIKEYFTVQNLQTDLLETEVFFERMLYSPSTLSYQDPITQRYYPGIIDLDKLTDENLNKTLNYTNKKTFSAKIDLEKEKITVYYHKRWYKRLAAASFLQNGGVHTVKRTIPITYEENGVFSKGVLKIHLIKKKS
ncbi:MAG: hypothetical protein ABIC91_01420 [Nanoarchaeota archaeon]|nr:hypothetical protein [Nanoarchaeota archaeon]MBU1029859.1 hypothetical protein [Nanoarchaeota archaeon]MBU1849291.1 hypothetical protein [Nanoarchaeota archaeon]